MTNSSEGQNKTRGMVILAIVAAFVLIALVVIVIMLVSSKNNTVTAEDFDPMKNYVATIVTDKGDITIELYADVAPKTVENFIKLAADGFYDGLKFHRVIAGFVAQGGDPAGDGSGGPGYTIEAEISDLKHLEGTVATARQGDQVNPGTAFQWQPVLHLPGAAAPSRRSVHDLRAGDRWHGRRLANRSG